jgi:hypothetical protein
MTKQKRQNHARIIGAETAKLVSKLVSPLQPVRPHSLEYWDFGIMLESRVHWNDPDSPGKALEGPASRIAREIRQACTNHGAKAFASSPVDGVPSICNNVAVSVKPDDDDASTYTIQTLVTIRKPR